MNAGVANMFFEDIELDKPSNCSLCNGKMTFKGVGEYRCDDCDHLEFDDYGKVRKYIEEHHGATVAEVERAVHVRQKVIRQMLREERFEITATSNVFMSCEVCGAEIRSGKVCASCTSIYNKKQIESILKKNDIKGIGMSRSRGTGEKRFRRENDTRENK